MAEQRTLNPQVLGSNPRGRTFPQVSRGWDPDRLSLKVMVRHTGEKISLDALCSAMARMSTRDVEAARNIPLT
jgi:hypothetical protein